ncbi:hypothetical protein DFAR_2590006 [Desulfarculales bacterium]
MTSDLDAQTLEGGLTLVQAQPTERVEAVTVGLARAAAVLERARGMSAQAGYHLLCQNAPSSLTVASWLAAWVRERSYDLILAGGMSQDAM